MSDRMIERVDAYPYISTHCRPPKGIGTWRFRCGIERTRFEQEESDERLIVEGVDYEEAKERARAWYREINAKGRIILDP